MGKRFLTKGRSDRTYKRKITKMKKLYKSLFKLSQKNKKTNPQGRYFCDKYPTCASFLSTVKIKECNINK